MDIRMKKYLSSIFRRLTSCAFAGASPFRFFTDKGVNSLAVYLTDDTLANVVSFKPHTGINVTNYFSDTDHKVEVKFVGQMICSALESAKKADVETYCLLSGPSDRSIEKKLKQLNYIPIYLSTVLDYSIVSTLILDKLTDLMRRYTGLRVLVVEPPLLGHVKNKSKWELSVNRGRPLPGGRKRIFKLLGYSDDYISEVCTRPSIVWDSEMAVMADKTGNYVNYCSGVRVTTDTPYAPEAYVHFCGHSTVLGNGVDDSNTMSSVLQRELNALSSPKYEVINRGNGGGRNYFEISSVLQNAKFQDNDIIIIMTGGGDEIA